MKNELERIACRKLEAAQIQAGRGEAVPISQDRRQPTSLYDNSGAQPGPPSSSHCEISPGRKEPHRTSSSTASQGRRERRILTPLQAAELLGCNDKTITRWARNGYLPAHPIGEGKKRYWRFFEDELIDWLTAQTNSLRAA